MTEDTSGKVVEQYEQYPYPLRDPLHERSRLVVRDTEYLPRINHHLFGGKQGFTGPFRILVAGGGTGDDLIFLAEQLRGRAAEIVYLDPSQPSQDIARARAEVRGLTNISFHRGLIQDLDPRKWGLFDYITCIGVLHHLPDPPAGLKALESVLAPDGGMTFLLYATHGRRGTYQVQRMMRLINGEGMALPRQVENAMAAIGALPEPHAFFRGGAPTNTLEVFRQDPVELVDAVLHAQDVSYTVPELHALLAGSGLHLVDFTNFSPFNPIYRLTYLPNSYVADPKLRAQIAALPRPAQQEIAELMHGHIDLHAFYASRHPNAAASVHDPEMVPFFMIAQAQLALTDTALSVTMNTGGNVTINLPPAGKALCAAIDGTRTVDQVVEETARQLGSASPGPAILRAMLEELFEIFFGYGLILLRHRSVAPFENFDDQYYPGAGWTVPENGL
jgi:SAM-dependent methyltransferase